MTLAEPLATFGQSTLLRRDPDIHIFHDVLFDPGVGGAVFDRARRLIPTAAYMRGIPNMHFIRAPMFSKLDPDLVPSDPTGLTYLFVGELHDHYGHFVVNTLSRFWALRQTLGPNVKLLFGNGQLNTPSFRQVFQADCFNALGLKRDDFVSISKPLRLAKLIVPEACFEENNLVYSTFSTMCHAIGNAILGQTIVQKTDQPVYLTKHKLHAGSSRIVNEEDIVYFLDKQGVKIVAPETMTFRDQIEMWQSHSVFSGWINSAMHTSSFVSSKKIVVLNYEAIIYSNQILVDRVNDNRSTYLYPENGIRRVDAHNGFGNNFQLDEPDKIGYEILRAIDRLATDSPGAGRLPPLPIRHDATLQSINLIGPNLAAGKPVSQSSTSEWSKHPVPAEEAIGATSGFLTGGYQFHTALEFQPWWSVDLKSQCQLRSIRLYNRCDDTSSRANHIEILTSVDNTKWHTLYYKPEGFQFGGLYGTPLIWRADRLVIARYIKVRLRDTNFLHLDQIEILGDVDPWTNNLAAD